MSTSKTSATRILVVGILAATGSAATASAAVAATVRHVTPSGADLGDCSVNPCKTIRYAISQSVSGDTISIAAGTYPEHLVVHKSLAFKGAGAASTVIDGSGTGRVIAIGSSSASLTVSLSKLTIQHGYAKEGAGGGLSSVPGSGRTNHVALTRVVVSANEATADGGGIDNAAGSTMMISRSEISGNSADGRAGGRGGGIFNAGVLTAIASTISENVTHGPNGGCGINFCFPGGAGLGGGLYDDTASTALLANTTVSGNTAAGGNGACGPTHHCAPGGDGRGGGIEERGTETSINTTIAGNLTIPGLVGGGEQTTYGGDIDTAGSVALTNTIVAGGSAANGPDCYGSVSSGGHNLLGDDTSCSGFTGTGDLVNVDPDLGPLQDNGGPTFTMALLAGSPAIDAADDGMCAAPLVNGRDQRGIKRPQGPHCDIGAFEQKG